MVKYLILPLFFFLGRVQVTPVLAQDEPEVSVGGALRFNYNLSSWKPEQKARGGDFGYDLFRINANAAYRGIYLNAEYRLYSEAFGGGMLKQGWFGYRFNERMNCSWGLHKYRLVYSNIIPTTGSLTSLTMRGWRMITIWG